MKTLHLTIIAIFALISSILIMPNAFAQNETSTNTNNVEIQNIQVEPSTIKVGDTLKITATLVNNSTNPIFLSYGVCEGKFSVIFDNHVAVDKKNVPCVLMAIEQRLDPGTKTTGTSPSSFPPHGTPTVTYTANATGIANATVTFSYSDSGIEKTISESFLFTINDNGTKIKTVNNTVLSPLEQFQSGTAASKVACNQGFQLILKREDTSPACVTPDTAQKLIERGWGFMRGVQTFFPLGNIANSTSSGNDTLHTQSTPSDTYPQNNTDTVNIGNQTFYFTTLNDTLSSYHGVAAIPFAFHGINFTLFPSVFSGGPPGNSTFSCGNTNFSSEVKFTNGTYEKLDVHIPGQPCSENYTETILSNHTHPQAGLEVYQGKIRLLVSTEGQSSFVMLPSSCGTPYPQSNTDIPVLYMPANSTGQLCVKYFNTSSPFQAGFDIIEARDYSKKAEGTTVSSVPDTVPQGNSTVVYTINSGPKAGFFRMLISCPGMQLAIGYDNNSNFVRGDFPWLDQTFYCGIGHDFQITGTSGIGVKFIPYS